MNMEQKLIELSQLSNAVLSGEVPQKIHRGGSGHATVFGTGAISLDEQKLIEQWCKDQENHEVFYQSTAVLGGGV